MKNPEYYVYVDGRIVAQGTEEQCRPEIKAEFEGAETTNYIGDGPTPFRMGSWEVNADGDLFTIEITQFPKLIHASTN